MTGAIIFCAGVIGGLYALMSGKLGSKTGRGFFFAGFSGYLLIHYGSVWMLERFLQAVDPTYTGTLNNPFLNVVTFPVAIILSMVIYGPIKRFIIKYEVTPEQEKATVEVVKQGFKQPNKDNKKSKPQKTERYNKSER